MKETQRIYRKIYNNINEDPKVKENSFIGNCRIWSRQVLLLIHELNKQNGYKIKAEAREIKLDEFSYHTFIRIRLDEEDFYLYDGIGTTKHCPYFGPEDDAPEHLRNSKPDMINYYLPKWNEK